MKKRPPSPQEIRKQGDDRIAKFDKDLAAGKAVVREGDPVRLAKIREAQKQLDEFNKISKVKKQ